MTWASLAMVHAELVLLSYALRDVRNERFVLLSETDVPLWPFDCAYDTLFSADASFLETRATDQRWSLFDFRNGTSPTAADWRKGCSVAASFFFVSRVPAPNLVGSGRSGSR